MMAEIPISELSLADASNASSDGGAYWLQTMPAVLFHYPISPSEYWLLSVGEHRALVDYLEWRELPIGADDGSG